ncbi:MAG: Eco57I restriction-modification methylase domain-containing protein [Balneolaceae bacterium]
MALFQNAVLNKYLAAADQGKVNAAWKIFKLHFHNPEIQENIRNSKEEEYQEGFLEDLFVKVLGYTKNPTPDFNLKVEQKNFSDSKKADGALLDGEKIRAVIELKGTETTDLGKVETQAFGYKNKQPDSVYVITSNFEKLRFYIDNAVEFLEFNLFQITKDEFKVLWLCLGHENFAKGLPKKIKDASLTEEENVTKKLYKDYSAFKNDIFDSIKKHNPEYDKLLLFKKTQKLLDRFLFIFFAEDRLLLPPNSIRQIIKQWMDLRDKYDEYVPLYERFKKYFGYMNEGYTGKNHEIFAYNGGLFAEDEILNDLTIDDDLLYNHSLQLSKYDFETEVDVNILGHIFEHSLNEIEEITAELEGQQVDRSKTRRKKDGVFYTPKYITKYIVENTVGKLCEEKKAELEIEDKDYRPNRQKQTKKPLIAKLDTYRDWLLDLTICDPACGSGAFLNQALEFLIEEHTYIDELQSKILNQPLVISDIENSILENNLFGVDINEESVEIAKLSLWLRTAQKGRKLTSLNNHIKCGNSLIDDPEVAGEKAFKWEEEFPTVFGPKEKVAYHVTFVTHNSRTSQRMMVYKVKKGDAFVLDDDLEVVVTNSIADIVTEDDLNVLAYNICADHVHMILVCAPDELPNIVRKLKGKSAQILKKHLKIPKEEKFHLWAQKFNRNLIEDEDELYNVFNYIHHNREKHNLPENEKLKKADKGLLPPTTGKGLQPLASSDPPLASSEAPLASQEPDRGSFGYFGMCCSYEYAFRPEYTGGFDVVIGNPPYVKLEKIKEISAALEKQGYNTFSKRGDLYGIFVEKGFELLKPKGIYSYIMPNKWLQAGYGKPLREFFLTKELLQLIDFGDLQIFEGATTYPCIFIARNDKPKEEFKVAVLIAANELDFNTNVQSNSETFLTKEFSSDTWVISSKLEKKLLNKVESEFEKLENFISDDSYRGILTGLTKAFIIPEEKKNELIKNDPNASKIIKPILRGRDIKKWMGTGGSHYLICTFPSLDIDINDYPSIKQYLLDFGKKRLEQSGEKESRKKTSNKWFETQDTIDYWEEFLKPKIMYQKFQVSPCFIYDEEGRYCNDSMWIIPTEDKGLLGVLNSKMGWWLITKYCTQIQGGCQLIWKYFGQIPVPELNGELDDRVDLVICKNNDLENITGSFNDLILSKFDIEKLSRKLENWHELSFKQFLNELKKKKVKLSLDKEAEWMEYFNKQKAKADTLKTQISQTDTEIDRMVYELYGLSEEEVRVVEGT